MSRDIIRVKNVSLNVTLDDGGKWPGPSLQPILVSLSILLDISAAAESDDLSRSINYSSICSNLTESIPSRSYSTLEDVSGHIFRLIFQNYSLIQEMTVSCIKVNAPLRCESVGYEATWHRDGSSVSPERFLVNGLACYAILGIHAFERSQKQAIRYHFFVERKKRLDIAFDFRAISQHLHEATEASSYLTLEALASFATTVILRHTADSSDTVTLRVQKPDALVFASPEVQLSRTRADFPILYPVENCHPLPLHTTPPQLELLNTADAATIGSKSASGPPVSNLSLFISQNTRSATVHGQMHTVAIALGSNLGDRFYNIELALRLLENPGDKLDAWDEAFSPGSVVVDTSFMYETAPMYVNDQPAFINCACVVETNLSPLTLLGLLKSIETTVGRVPSIRNGPRAVDLDILLYDHDVIDTRAEEHRHDLDNLTGELVVPHPRMSEREFVLRPLADILPDYVHPSLGKTVHQLLVGVTAIQSGLEDSFPMMKILPFPSYPRISLDSSVPKTATYWTYPPSTNNPATSKKHRRKTYIMATLNATPDSFSDGSVHNTLPAASSYVASSVAAGANIIDIGGYSTRPGAVFVSPEEEIVRVVPIVRAIRNAEGDTAGDLSRRVQSIPISVDTFRPEVAKAAVLAGANCINDVYAFMGPEYPLSPASVDHLRTMRALARDLVVPVILMHSRGDAGSNKDYATYECDDGTSSVVEAIKAELGLKVDAIVRGRGGVRRWLVIVDPGVGFSKTFEGNLDVLRCASSITASGYIRTSADGKTKRNPLAGFPQLIGASRKSFLGAILAEPDPQSGQAGRKTEPKERGWATAAAVACAVSEGALVVRVHDVLEMGDVVKVSSALWG